MEAFCLGVTSVSVVLQKLKVWVCCGGAQAWGRKQALGQGGVAGPPRVSPHCHLLCQVSRLESFWALRVVCPEQLTALLAWIREPWEELFSIGLRTVIQETLDLDG